MLEDSANDFELKKNLKKIKQIKFQIKPSQSFNLRLNKIVFFNSIKSHVNAKPNQTHLKKGKHNCNKALLSYISYVGFIKMMLVIYKAHFTSRYQIFIISNSWKLFFFYFFFVPSLSRWLQFVHLTLVVFSVCIFIANANELVGKSCVIKFYFQRIQNHARNATFFLEK